MDMAEANEKHRFKWENEMKEEEKIEYVVNVESVYEKFTEREKAQDVSTMTAMATATMSTENDTDISDIF